MRPTDTERGARMAASMASAVLNAHHGASLFPLALTGSEKALWCGILDAAHDALADAAPLRAARIALRSEPTS